MEFGAVEFEAVEVDTDSRDDIPVLPLGPQNFLGDI